MLEVDPEANSTQISQHHHPHHQQSWEGGRRGKSKCKVMRLLEQPAPRRGRRVNPIVSAVGFGERTAAFACLLLGHVPPA